MKIALASENENKIKEFKEILEPLGYDVLTPKDLHIDMSSVVEDGLTFRDNALIKAEYLFNQTHIPSIADDSGIVIESLPDILGIHSARFLENESYDVKNKEILYRLKDKDNRQAYFVSVIAYVTHNSKETFVGEVHGLIHDEPKGNDGFGYDPIFKPHGYDKTFAQISAETKNEISHRAIAIRKFTEYINEK